MNRFADTAPGGTLHRASPQIAPILDRQFFPTQAAPAPARAAAAPAETKAVTAPADTADRPAIDGYILNVRPDPVDLRDLHYQTSLVEIQAWLVPPPVERLGLVVRDQGREGSCTGHALAAVIDFQNVRRFADGADVPQRVSARMLYEQARLSDEFAEDGLPGSSARGAIKGFYHSGVCDAALAPYFEGDINWRLTLERSKDARRVTLGAYFRLHHILNDYHAALNEARAIFCTAMIHGGWTKQTVAANQGRIVMPGTPPQVAIDGAHAFAIVGYDLKGFIVLNSWGPEWGGYRFQPTIRGPGGPAAALTPPPFDPLPGMAHWSYEDWAAHVLDAWVLRLQAPTQQPTGFVGGFYLRHEPSQVPDPRQATVKAERSGTATPNRAIIGHYIHVDDGAYVTDPPYANNRNTFEETARFLIENGESNDRDARYDHLTFFAHGGLNPLSDATERAAAMTPGFKRNGVYPVFYIWRTGLEEIASDLTERAFVRAAARAGGLSDFTDQLIEASVGRLGRPLWREMKKDAGQAFAAAPPPGETAAGAAWEATSLLIRAAQARTRHPLRLHFIGHSAGAILLSRLIGRARAEGLDLAQLTSTISLFAPASDMTLFDRTVLSFGQGLPPRSLAIYNLTDRAEQDDNVARLYRKSLLYLISNGFEDTTGTRLAGLDRDWTDAKRISVDYHLSPTPSGHVPAFGTQAHGAFDNDPAVMNHVLARILGTPPEPQKAFTARELASDNF